MYVKDAAWVAPLLAAVAQGETLQVRNTDQSIWVDLTYAVNFNNKQEHYRIKPKVPEYRLYKYTDGQSLFLVQRNTKWVSEKGYLSAVENAVQSGKAVWVTPWLPLEQGNEK